MTDMVPRRILDARTASFGIGHLIMYEEYDGKNEHDAQANWLFDTIIPPFQRELVWDTDMMIRFIESAWMGMDIGRYVVNDASDAPSRKLKGDGIQWHPTDRWLIDGQQRLTAIKCYLNNEFPIRGADGESYLWSELTQVDRRRFGNIPFDRCITRISTELDLRVLYDRLNYGGVAHREDQRALPDGEPEGWTPGGIR